MTSEVVQRFWTHVEKTENCWLWTGGVSFRGYGQFYVGKQTLRAHRFAYELSRGSAEGIQIHHSCGNRLCVNLDHLVTLTAAEHARLHAEKRRPARCRHGHPYNEENSHFYRGIRRCRACRRKRENARYAKARDQRQATGRAATRPASLTGPAAEPLQTDKEKERSA